VLAETKPARTRPVLSKFGELGIFCRDFFFFFLLYRPMRCSYIRVQWHLHLRPRPAPSEESDLAASPHPARGNAKRPLRRPAATRHINQRENHSSLLRRALILSFLSFFRFSLGPLTLLLQRPQLSLQRLQLPHQHLQLLRQFLQLLRLSLLFFQLLPEFDGFMVEL
jgi:hypothetical protein